MLHSHARGVPAARALVRQLKHKQPEPPKTEWRRVPTAFWLARATDGKGHHDGAREYDVDVPIEDLGPLFFPSGEARFTEVHGGDGKIYTLPAAAPPAGEGVRFRLAVCAEGAMGKYILAAGLEVRAQQ